MTYNPNARTQRDRVGCAGKDHKNWNMMEYHGTREDAWTSWNSLPYSILCSWESWLIGPSKSMPYSLIPRAPDVSAFHGTKCMIVSCFHAATATSCIFT